MKNGAQSSPSGPVRKVMCLNGTLREGAEKALQSRGQQIIDRELKFWNPSLSSQFAVHGIRQLWPQCEPAEATEATVAAVLRHLLWKRFSQGHEGRKPSWRLLSEQTRWYAVMLSRWLDNSKARADLRQFVLEQFKKEQPDILCAHGLAGVVLFDVFGRKENARWIKHCDVITTGSQLGNPRVRAAFGGQIIGLPARHWFNLHDPHDECLSAPLQEVRQKQPGGAGHFRELLTTSEPGKASDEDPFHYLEHPNARYGVWRALSDASPMPYDGGMSDGWAAPARPPDLVEPVGKSTKTARPIERAFKRGPDQKALIVGINDYPDPGHKLEGCINDAYLASEFLQELNYPESNIRLLTNERATAEAIRDRLEWLLRDTTPNSYRVFYFAGHGAQIGSYGVGEQVDALDECLVPYDFDWSTDRAIMDDWFFDLYSQLSYNTQFFVILDCCHAGGMNRDGSRVRGLNPPPDVRHRLMSWQRSESRDNVIRDGRWHMRSAFAGKGTGKSVRRSARLKGLGGSRALRGPSTQATATKFGHQGPYMPVLFKGCGEGQLAQEYHDGSIAYGAFTYAMHRVLQKARDSSKAMPNPKEIITLVKQQFRDLGIAGQTPDVDGPSAWLKRPFVNWET